MPVKLTAYDTVAMSGHQVTKIVDALQVAQISGLLVSQEGFQGAYMVDNNYSPERNPVPAFLHPVLFKDNAKNDAMAIDVRGFTRFDQPTGKTVVRLAQEYSQARDRLLLNILWIEENPAILRDISPMPMSVYCSWISERVKNRFDLDAQQQLNLAIWSGFFYTGLFSEKIEVEERDFPKVCVAIAKACRCDVEEVMRLLDQRAFPSDIAEFSEGMENITGSVRLREMSAGILYSLLIPTWFGPNVREIIPVALEHPPTWFAVVIASLNERAFKNSGIARITERPGYRDPGKALVSSISKLLRLH